MIIKYGDQDIHLPDDPDVTGWFEDEAEIRESYWRVQADDVAMDIGCHIGGYTLPALAAGATVYAIDPSAGYTATLARLFVANKDSLPGHLIIINEALAEEGGYAPAFRAALDAAPYPEHHAAAAASFSTLDSLARRMRLSRLDWIKIDVEGAELGILRGGMNTLRWFKPQLLIEDHTDVYPFVAAMESERHCFELLQSTGYTVNKVRYSGHLTPDRTFWVCNPVTGDENE